MKKLLALAVCLLPLAALSCFHPDPPRPKNVLVLLVDTLRADHLAAYGYGRPTSAAFDAFARAHLFFREARSQASCTFPSVNSLLTSRFPQAFLGQPNEGMGIPATIPSLAEILSQKGFRTAAVSASPIVRKSPTRFNPHGGFERGFATFVEDCLWQPAECVNRKGLEQLAVADPRPFFLYLHYIDPHGPYSPPPSYRRRFATGTSDKAFIRDGNPNPIADHLYKGAPDPGVTTADLQHLVDLYDDEIAYLDGQLGHLLKALGKSGRLDDTIVIFAADHGEDFLDHGHVKHCRTLFDTEIRTPLAMSIPGTPAAQAVDRPVENLDIVPTVLDYLGFGTEGRALAGRSLRPLIERRQVAEVVQRSALGTFRAVSDGRFKLLHDLASHRFQLFDLTADPQEAKDVLAQNRREFHRLRLALSDWLAQAEGTALSESVKRAELEERKLRSLGYIE